MKICKVCLIEKPLEMFNNSGKYKMSKCKVCLKEYNKEYISINKETLSTIHNSFSRSKFTKNGTIENIIGCSFLEFKLYIESKFYDWMTWDNKGLYNGELNYGWDIDHIIPVSSASTEEEILKLNHYTNLQPLCSKINRDIKKDKIL